MKQLVLTGVAQETSLSNPDDTYILLVFNNGEVRVPTSESGLQAILECIGEASSEEAEVGDHPDGAEVFGGNGASSSPAGWPAHQQDDDGVTDDGDYDDINDGVGSV